MEQSGLVSSVEATVDLLLMDQRFNRLPLSVISVKAESELSRGFSTERPCLLEISRPVQLLSSYEEGGQS
ncbi:hypothetical protein PBY51_008606 [Eleginops maclovinus]|uniref:Uncharacterized protein n=1 Tax=Eleginops maclovinus TaxID=56733 RepID=A0AAN8ABJ1_ELEMC|nr:hypothetical protein PBY51_008606 [Eleginops maclovinus]